jgi:putative oxidoreductase
MSAGLLLARLILGFGIAAHGSQKLFGWFGGYGPKGTGGWLEQLGYRPGHLYAIGAGLGELGGGLLIALGFLNGLGPALVVMVMIVAIFSVHVNNGFFNDKQGWELPAMYIAGALALDFGGFGTYSLDSLLGISVLASVSIRWILIAVAVVLAFINLVTRRQVPQQAT